MPVAPAFEVHSLVGSGTNNQGMIDKALGRRQCLSVLQAVGLWLYDSAHRFRIYGDMINCSNLNGTFVPMNDVGKEPDLQPAGPRMKFPSRHRIKSALVRYPRVPQNTTNSRSFIVLSIKVAKSTHSKAIIRSVCQAVVRRRIPRGRGCSACQLRELRPNIHGMVSLASGMRAPTEWNNHIFNHRLPRSPKSAFRARITKLAPTVILTNTTTPT
jgi:hypothetical protein